MSNYAVYKASKGISNGQVIATVRRDFPGYSKIQNSMVMNPERYGVKLTEDAEAALISAYGDGPGLDISCPARRSTGVRKKPNRLVVRLGDELYNRVRDLMTELGYKTTQDFLEDALTSMVEQSIGGAE